MNMIFSVLIIAGVCSTSAKHVFISSFRSWWGAQEYCRTYFTDLLPITSEMADEALRLSVTGYSSGWIGLYRDPNTTAGWRWSGGGQATYHKVSQSYYDHVSWSTYGWYTMHPYSYRNFFCLNLTLVEEKKTWEEALEHCRETNSDLTSLATETDHLLAQKAIQKSHITQQVWIGLRFLQDRWLWVNQDPLEYQAWPQGGDQDHQCPLWKRCGVLTKEGQWENWDCQDKLNFICI